MNRYRVTDYQRHECRGCGETVEVQLSIDTWSNEASFTCSWCGSIQEPNPVEPGFTDTEKSK